MLQIGFEKWGGANMPSVTCRICGKPLSDHTSVKLGIGPVCRVRDSLNMDLDLLPHAEFIIQVVTGDYIYIKDCGGNSKSVTNDAENVLIRLAEEYGELKKRRVFYMDTLGQIDELVHKDGHFVSFKAGHKGVELCA
jgi:hypothetical protein